MTTGNRPTGIRRVQPKVKVYRKPLRIPRGSYARPSGSHLSIEIWNDKKTFYPTVHISSLAHGKMRALVDAARPNEVSWLPAVDILADGSVKITDIFVPGQINGPGTTVVTSDGESDLYSELIAAGNTQTIKRLIGWGHSHVEFSVFASNTDEDTTWAYLRDFHERGKTHFVRLIANYYDDLYASIYFLQEGKAVHHAPIVAEPTNTHEYRAWAQDQINEKVYIARPARTQKHWGGFPNFWEGHYDDQVVYSRSDDVGAGEQPNVVYTDPDTDTGDFHD